MTEVLRLPGRYFRMYPSEAMLGYAQDELELERSTTALLLVDVYGQQYDDDPPSQDGLPPVYRSGPDDPSRAIVRERIVPARSAARRAGLPVIYLTNALRAGLSEGNEWRTMSVRTCGVDVLDVWQEPNDILAFSTVIAPGPGEPLVEKQVYSGFFETHLDSVLRGRGVRNLIVAGGDGLICLGTTCVDAMYRDYRVVGLRDAIITGEWPETREGRWRGFMAIRQLEAIVGYTANTDEFIAACDAVAATPVASRRTVR
jgi:nicotinamidase-related amidase